MLTVEFFQRLGRLALVALVAAVVGTLGVSVQELSGGGFGCVDYRCTDDNECQNIQGTECDICHTDKRCALLPN